MAEINIKAPTGAQLAELAVDALAVFAAAAISSSIFLSSDPEVTLSSQGIELLIVAGITGFAWKLVAAHKLIDKGSK